MSLSIFFTLKNVKNVFIINKNVSKVNYHLKTNEDSKDNYILFQIVENEL